MPKKHRLPQPTATPRTTAEPPVFHLQTLPDPESCLTEVQKTWPLCNTWKPYEPDPEAKPAEPAPQPSSPADAP
jgi:hypothetical protein